MSDFGGISVTSAKKRRVFLLMGFVTSTGSKKKRVERGGVIALIRPGEDGAIDFSRFEIYLAHRPA